MTVKPTHTRTLHQIMLVDDHPLFLEGLQVALHQRLPEANIIQVTSGAEAVSQVLDAEPELLITDLSMPGISGLELIERITSEGYQGLIMVLTSFDSPEFMEHALDLGVTGYLLKDCALDDIAECLDAIIGGEIYVSSKLLGGSSMASDSVLDHVDLQQLTDTERTIMKYLASFKTNKQIAKDLNISYRTVQNHRYNISKKLDVSGSHQLLHIASVYRDVL